ncbi:hypothetical protein Terro_1191 [Terriglobus roseus DSM 18391]|uniref:Uncharacterized protein n=1 Tax=Terriglobus roseus (strain DSM 18391 / NRRL B-41598 / KBS 63) TaxID=926566 RepID=I3ZE33_TERRK|nr:hypothetical protein [Terriglobus roseus]AFL87501.1 hypothetical protein Terro_1191 [Terriglobus roseus DSM 18391]
MKIPRRLATLALYIAMGGCRVTSSAQDAGGETPQQKLQRLSAAVAQAQAQMQAYQAQLQELQKQLGDLQSQLQPATVAPAPAPLAATTASTQNAMDEIRERQAIQEAQIATHDQAKVETESKYPVKLSGLILFNAFVNTRRVDDTVDPTYALPGSGTTGFSVRQTILGLEANGPHLFGATSHADVHVDFFGNGSQATYGSTGILRLRTAHGSLRWKNTEAFVALDRSLLAPNMPTSLVATAQPVFSWSGDLWTWNPQIGLTHELALTGSKRLRLQAALIDPQDPLLPNTTSTATSTRSEKGRWPGIEERIAFAAGDRFKGPEFGVGGYFSPHRTGTGRRFDAWAITADARLPIGKHVEITSNVYRGAALGGLGGGGYVDYFYLDPQTAERAYALRAAGGWAQLKVKPSERLQFNGGFGIDNPFGSDIRLVRATPSTAYSGLTKNRSAFGNVIFSPSAYLLFSVEYRRLWSDYLDGIPQHADNIGVSAGYRF